MELSQVMTKARSISELRDIFAKNVQVSLGYTNDIVTVEGYEGSVTTDDIARKLMRDFFEAENQEGAKQLADLIAKKVFLPLKDLVESRQNRCALYQITALTRITWTPPPAEEFGSSIALKHAMALGCLDQGRYPW